MYAERRGENTLCQALKSGDKAFSFWVWVSISYLSDRVIGKTQERYNMW